MFNKNSGHIQDFFNKKTYLLAFLFLQLTYSQICLQFQGSSCVKCASDYQLVEKGCVSLSSINYTDNPMLIFQDIPGVQKVLYGVSPVIVSIQYGNGFKQEEKNIVNKFEVTKVKSDIAGNFYEVKTNDIKLQNSSNTSVNSSILLQVSSSNISNITFQKGKQSNNNQSLFSDLTKINQSIIKSEDYLNLIKISQQSSQNLTKINQKQQQIDLTKASQIKPKIQDAANISLYQIKQMAQDDNDEQISLSKINQSSSTKQNISSIQPNQTDAISTNNSNNTEFLLQLQQINLKLTQIGQVIDPNTLSAAKKISSSPLTTQSSLVQASQSQQDTIPPSRGTINIQLTQVGQKLTEIPQSLTAAKMKNQLKTEESTGQQQVQINILNNFTQIPPVIFPKLLLNDSPYLSNPSQGEEIKLVAAKQQIYINWVKATRYQLYNLTYVPQSLIQVKVKQSDSTTQENNATYIFKCLSKLILFVTPNSSLSEDQKLYSEYFKNISNIAEKQFKKSILADKSTLCLDPPFDNSYKQLLNKYKSKIEGKPILAVYYDYCGFGKSFRIFFVQDSNFPEITIYQASIVVDLFRMMPQQVFFSIYDKKLLKSS